MNETKGCMIFLCTAFLLFFFFLLTATISTGRKLDAFIQNQQKLNETTWEQDEQQNKEIRQLKQDAEISRNILTSKEFIKQ